MIRLIVGNNAKLFSKFGQRSTATLSPGMQPFDVAGLLKDLVKLVGSTSLLN